MKTAVALKAEVLKALAHPNRIRILEALKSEETCNCELGPKLGLEQSNLSRHIAILVRAGLILSRKEGVKTFYRVIDEKVYLILDLAKAVVVKQLEQQTASLKL